MKTQFCEPSAGSLERALRDIDRAVGGERVITDPELTEPYAGDESETPRRRPDAVVRAQSTADVVAVMQAASRHGVAVTPRAGGTGRTGGAVPVAGGILLAFEQQNQIKGISRDDLTAVVEPGVITGQLHETVEAEGLFYPPDPNSLDACAIGGNVAENAGGPRTLRYGPTRDYVLGMQVVSAGGELLSLGKQTVKGVTGYDLCSLIVGSEGTLGMVTEVTLKLIPKPQSVATMLLLLPDTATASRAVASTLACGLLPRCLELLDEATLEIVRPDAGLPLPEEARALIVLELDGDETLLERQVERCGNAVIEAGAIDVLVARHGGERDKLWAARRHLSYSLRKVTKNKLAEDVVVPRSKIPLLIDECRAISERHQVRMPSYGHAGDGNIHVNFLWNDDDERPRVEAAIEALFRKVVSLGGTLSGEHGIGVLKAPYLPLEQSPQVIALQEQVKNLFDPQGILNPGKIFPSAVGKRLHGEC